MWTYALLIFPALLGVLALRTDYLPFKVGVPAACGLILVIHFRSAMWQNRQVGWIIAAFILSMVGDYFLSNRGGSEAYFVLGIGAYFLAHLGYLAFALADGELNWIALGILLVGYLAYYVWKLRPAIDTPVLSLAALLYLVVSCASLAAALGMRAPALAKACYVGGIVLILLSDTLISFNEFLGYRTFNQLILPTYYLAQISITLSVLLKSLSRP